MLVNGTTGTFSTGSTNDPASSFDDSGWNTAGYTPQGTNNKTAGVRFNVNTLAYSDIVVRWDLRVSSTASKYYRLQYSTDGIQFSDYPTFVSTLAVVSTASYYEAQSNSLAAIPQSTITPISPFVLSANSRAPPPARGRTATSQPSAPTTTAAAARSDMTW